ncbi:MAG: thiol-disulfide oxidoreductase DCC family protein [Burkholderiaceae bacterium]
MTSDSLDSGPVIVFDGICHFCSWIVQFLLEHDRSGKLMFAPVQSVIGDRLMRENGISTVDPDSFLLVSNEQVFVKSDAVLEVLKYLGPWRMLRVFGWLPRFLRDTSYDLIARNRYKLFGKREICFVPTPEQRARFLD